MSCTKTTSAQAGFSEGSRQVFARYSASASASGAAGRNKPPAQTCPAIRNHSPPPGQSPICVAFVSGPRIVTLISPSNLLTTSSQRLAAMERNGSAPSLCERQTRSTKGESDGLSSSKIIILCPLELTCSQFAILPQLCRTVQLSNRFSLPPDDW